jgi:hypothetical protein
MHLVGPDSHRVSEVEGSYPAKGNAWLLPPGELYEEQGMAAEGGEIHVDDADVGHLSATFELRFSGAHLVEGAFDLHQDPNSPICPTIIQ